MKLANTISDAEYPQQKYPRQIILPEEGKEARES
jgi:hypothetical protein